MKRERIKRLLDFIPLIIFAIYSGVLIWTIFTTDYILTWRNLVGIMVLPLNLLFFKWQYRAGVLFLGVIIFLGLFGILSYTPGLTDTTVTFRFNDSSVEFWGQPIFLLWMLIHFILSGRYYVGILSRSYWRALYEKRVEKVD